jgi:putative transposase
MPLASSHGEECGVPCLGLGIRAILHQKQTLDFLMRIGYICSMKMMLSAKLKLQTTPQQCAMLRATQLAYRDALNFVSRYAFAYGKMSNKVALQDGTYADLRTRFHLPAQMACSVPRQVGVTYKGLWTKVKQNAAHRQAGRTKKRYKGLDQPATYVSPTLEYHLDRDYPRVSQRES